MKPKLPKCFQSTSETEIDEDVAPYRNLSPTERGRIIAMLCRASWKILRARPDLDRVLAWRDPLPDDSRRILQRLRKRYRRGRT